MSSNKSARQELERIFGKICMIEAAGIRYIPKEKRRRLKGYTKYDDILTYHHIKEKQHGGKATAENGAIVRGYNHRWLHSLSEEEKEKVNQQLIEFKASIIQAAEGRIQQGEEVTFPLETDFTDCITIPVYDNEIKKDNSKKKSFNRAKEKREFQKRIDRYFEDREDDWER